MENNLGIKVLGARVVILEEKAEDTLKSGIILPGNSKQPTFRGTVIAVGDGAMLDNGEKVPMVVAVGDKVIYTNWSGSPLEIPQEDGKPKETYMILNERDILCIIED